MHTPSDLLGHSISQMENTQAIHMTTVTQATQPPYKPLHMSTAYIGCQYSMGGQPLGGGKPSTRGKCFNGGEPTWLQHQQS